MSSKKPSSKNSSKTSLKGNSNVQSQLNEFYKVAKEKLTAVKNEVETAKKEYLAQKEINRKKDLEYNELLNESKLLDMRIKGMNEKLIISKKNENALQSQINEMRGALDSANAEIDYLKIETNKKVESIQNKQDYVNDVKKNKVNDIQERIKKEDETKKELEEKIKEVESKIKEYMYKIDMANNLENKKNNIIINEAHEMNKFLSEL